MTISSEYHILHPKFKLHSEKEEITPPASDDLTSRTARIAHTAGMFYRMVTRRQYAVQVIPRTHAREIMGSHFFGVEEWAIRFGVRFSDETLHKVADFPWKKETLDSACPFTPGRAVRETHFAYLGLERANSLPANLVFWQKLCEAYTSIPRFSEPADQSRYRNEAFALKETCAPRWYLMPILPSAAFRENTYEKQVEMRPREYETPLLVEEAAKLILWHQKSALALNQARYSRVHNFDGEGKRVMVRVTEDDGLEIASEWDNVAHPIIGIALSRKMFT